MANTQSLFTVNNYRDGIVYLLSRSERQGKKIKYQTLAENILVQKSYISKVMNGYADLSADQMYLVCEYLEVPENEAEFLLLLLEQERSSVATRKKSIAKKIQEIKKNELNLSKQLGSETTTASVTVSQYFMDPYAQLVNQFLEVEKFAKNIDSVRQQLGLPEKTFHELLRKLENDGFIEYVDGNYRSKEREVFLMKDDPLFTLWINNQRMLSQTKMSMLPIDKYFSFNILFSAGAKARMKIQGRFREFLDDVQKIAQGAKKESVFQMGFDLLPWSDNAD